MASTRRLLHVFAWFERSTAGPHLAPRSPTDKITWPTKKPTDGQDQPTDHTSNKMTEKTGRPTGQITDAHEEHTDAQPTDYDITGLDYDMTDVADHLTAARLTASRVPTDQPTDSPSGRTA